MAGFKVEKVWGEIIEDQGSQITFSALGQQAPLDEKDKWDPDFTKRKKIKAILDTFIPEFSVRMGGATSIDVIKPGIDKAYGVRKLRDILGISLKEMIFIGDALFVGGNQNRRIVIVKPNTDRSEAKPGPMPESKDDLKSLSMQELQKKLELCAGVVPGE